MISLHGIQELHLLLWPHADLPSVRHVFSWSAVGRREVRLLPTARCLECFQAGIGPGLAILYCSITWKYHSAEKETPLSLQVMSAKYQSFSGESKSRRKLYAAFWDFSSFSFLFRTHVFRYQKVANACQKAAGGGVCWRLVLARVLPLAANGHVLAQLLLKSLIDKSGSAKVACTPSSWARLFYLESTMEDS